MKRAASLGLDAISLTDHDTVQGVETAVHAGRRLGVRVVPGVEFSAEFRGHEVHLLAYGFDPDAPGLRTALQAYRSARAERAERIVERLNQLGLRLTMQGVRDVAGEASLGRPHLADALFRSRIVSSPQEAFEKYLNPGRPAFVSRRQIPLEEAKRLAREAGGVLVLAHPHLNLSSGNIHALVDDGIDGLETTHPRLKPSQCRELASLAESRGLLSTGGSDCHGSRRGPIRMGT
ncbi:MAG TPA: PHP domain-containing protein, partial [Candidatus Polarisedimenticolia bacterium]|nr:PHP domain-containing protein [Candidatus Polarisedimenticolia bacterium]